MDRGQDQRANQTSGLFTNIRIGGGKPLKNILYIRKMDEEEGNISENDFLQKNKTLANTSVS